MSKYIDFYNNINIEKDNLEPFFRSLFVIEIPKEEQEHEKRSKSPLRNDTTVTLFERKRPKSFYQLEKFLEKRLTGINEPEWNSFVLELPDLILEEILCNSIENFTKRGIKKQHDNNCIFSTNIESVEEDNEIIENTIYKFQRTPEQKEIIQLLINRYLYEKPCQPPIWDKTKDFIHVLSAFIVLNELLNLHYQGVFSFRVEEGKIDTIKKNNYSLEQALTYKNKDDSPNKVLENLLEQYHTLNFPVYTHSKKLAELLLDLDTTGQNLKIKGNNYRKEIELNSQLSIKELSHLLN